MTTPPKVKPKFITIRVWGGAYEAALQPTAKRFEAATGVAVHYDDADEFVSYAKLDKQIRAGERPSDDASLQAQQRAYLDSERGLTLPISAKVAPNMLKANFPIAAPQGTKAGATTWAYANPYSVTVAFAVRTDKVNPADVQTWSDIFKPEFAHSLVVDQIYSSTAFGLVSRWASTPPREPRPASTRCGRSSTASSRTSPCLEGSTDVSTALANGTGTVGITCTCNVVTSTGVTPGITLVAPKDGMYMVADGYYIHKNIPAANYYYAQLFANYLYSPQTQADLAAGQATVPTVPGVKVPAYMTAQPDVFPLTTAEIKAAHAVVAPIPVMAQYDTTGSRTLKMPSSRGDGRTPDRFEELWGRQSPS